MRFKNIELQLLLLLTYVVIISSNDAIRNKISLWTNEKQIDDLTKDELRNKIMKIFEDDIVKDTPEEVCIRIANLSLIDSCFVKPIRIIHEETKRLLVASSNLTDYSSLKIFLDDHHRLNELNLLILAKHLDLLLEVAPIDDYYFLMGVLKRLPFYYFNLPPLSKHFFLKFLSRIRDNNFTLRFVDDDYVLRVWNPFSDDRDAFDNVSVNASGFVFPEGRSHTELYTNRSVDDNINGTSRYMEVHITPDYLNYLNDTLSAEEKRNFRVMIIVLVDEILSQLFLRHDDKYLGIYMPGICIDTNLPIIKIGRNKLSRTIKLNEFDSLGCASTYCPVYEMLFLDITTVFNKNDCPKFIDSSTSMIWPEIRDTSSPYYSENFCYADMFEIPRLYCYNHERQLFVEGSNQVRCVDEVPSSTAQLYQTFKCCNYRNLYCAIGEKLQFMPAQSYIDVKIQTEYYVAAREVNTGEVSLEKVLDVIDVGLDILKVDQNPFNLFDLIIRLYWNAYSFNRDSLNEKKRKNFICRTMKAETRGMGFSLRKSRDNSEEGYDYNLEYLPFNNTTDHPRDDDIEAFVSLVQPQALNSLDYAAIFIIPNSEFAPNLSFKCKSRILIVATWGYVFDEYFRIYLKIVDTPGNFNRSTNEGYWFNLKMKSTGLTFVCVSENLDNANKTITARQYNRSKYRESSFSISNITVTDAGQD